MREAADGEGTGDGHDHVPFLSEEDVHTQDGLSAATEDNQDAHIDGVLAAVPLLKRSQPPQTPPPLDASSSDLLLEEKDREETLNLEANPHRLKAELQKISPKLLCGRIAFLCNQRGGRQQQPQSTGLTSGWFRKMEAFVKKCRETCLTEVLFRETDIEFLHQLLHAIYSPDTKRVDILDPLVASPSVLHRERTKEFFARIEES